ncbi:MAG: hypothetical protein QM783_06590 [Phycisphaerales bacterium]
MREAVSGQNASAGGKVVGDVLMVPRDLYLAVCDRASVFNRPTVVKEAWESTVPDDPDRLFRFNSCMVREMEAGRALVWLILLWGVFRLKVRVYAAETDLPPVDEHAPLLGSLLEAVVTFETGELGWFDMHNGEGRWHAVARVTPGAYRCRLSGAENQEHWDLTEPSQYPPDDEDWTLHMAPV